MAYEALLAFQIACRKLALMISGLISDLRASAASYDRLHLLKPESLFTDRKYHGHRLSGNNRPFCGQDNHYSNNRPGHSQGNRDRLSRAPSRAKCYVCDKEGCRSWKHTREERDKARSSILPKYRQYLLEEDDSNNSNDSPKADDA
jgi:hypothetical protein